jgi:hypothetical protein
MRILVHRSLAEKAIGTHTMPSLASLTFELAWRTLAQLAWLQLHTVEFRLALVAGDADTTNVLLLVAVLIAHADPSASCTPTKRVVEAVVGRSAGFAVSLPLGALALLVCTEAFAVQAVCAVPVVGTLSIFGEASSTLAALLFVRQRTVELPLAIMVSEANAICLALVAVAQAKSVCATVALAGQFRGALFCLGAW